jgi:hypothetical protein
MKSKVPGIILKSCKNSEKTATKGILKTQKIFCLEIECFHISNEMAE